MLLVHWDEFEVRQDINLAIPDLLGSTIVVRQGDPTGVYTAATSAVAASIATSAAAVFAAAAAATAPRPVLIAFD